ncbi:MAG: signal peptidase I [Prevotella sp.]|nr:signal peptidase I [Prevotella sp.]
MRDVLKFTVVLVAAVIVMLLVRTYAFSIYRVTSADLEPRVMRNSRVMVNKFRRSTFQRGDLIVFRTDSSYIGVIEQLPGDTVMISNEEYVLPNNCSCHDCDCLENNCYLVNQGRGMTVVRQQEIVGSAFLLNVR